MSKSIQNTVAKQSTVGKCKRIRRSGGGGGGSGGGGEW